jgi:multifunctional beta-oxidation protein
MQKGEESSEVNQEILGNIEEALKAEGKGSEFKYEDRDVILYNLGIGAKKADLSLVL